LEKSIEYKCFLDASVGAISVIILEIFCMAAAWGDVELCRFLIAQGPNVNGRDLRGPTAMIIPYYLFANPLDGIIFD
jgi:hypothetical protein